MKISYDAATGAYMVTDGTQSATFSAASLQSNGMLDRYTDQSGTNTLDVLSNVRAGAPPQPIALTYLSFARWSNFDSATANGRVNYLLFGYPTNSSDMPRRGTATYDAMVSVTSVTDCYDCKATDVTGTATFTADFGRGSVSTNLVLADVGTFQGTGAIRGNLFSGTFSASFVHGGWLEDSAFNGGFFGPGAAEMGYTFSIHHRPDPYAGAVAEFDDFYVGAVVGKAH